MESQQPQQTSEVDKIRLTVKSSAGSVQGDDTVHFKVKRSTRLQKLMEAYCQRVNLN